MEYNSILKRNELSHFSLCFIRHKDIKELYYFLKTYLLERERKSLREREQEWEGKREGERESQADSSLSIEPIAGFDSNTLRS